MSSVEHEKIWKCNTCTLVNRWSDEECLACTRRRPYNNNNNNKKSKIRNKRQTATSSSSTSNNQNNNQNKKTNRRKTTTTPQPRKKLRQANENNGVVAPLCYACRHDPGNTKQAPLSSFFQLTSPTTTVHESAPPNCCSRCRKPLTKPSRRTAADHPPFITGGALPQIERLKRYRKAAKEYHVPFEITDREATNVMAMDCSLCGVPAAPEVGHGITRLRVWPERLLERREACLKPFMGPFVAENIAPACSTCNLMKGHRYPSSYIQACRHISTHQNLGNYGLYPQAFRNNISKRSRSSYITSSSTHTKTHSLTNAQFNAITARPCYYCGKESSPDTEPPHYNGLDRIDSDNRIYDVGSVVSCCGDCNMMKYVHSLEKFLSHVHKVAEYNAGVVFSDGVVCIKEGTEGGTGNGTENTLVTENLETND